MTHFTRSCRAREHSDKQQSTDWCSKPNGSLRQPGRFLLITRMYWRKAELVDSRWTAPAVQRVN